MVDLFSEAELARCLWQCDLSTLLIDLPTIFRHRKIFYDDCTSGISPRSGCINRKISLSGALGCLPADTVMAGFRSSVVLVN
jgi:hypothetical protein